MERRAMARERGDEPLSWGGAVGKRGVTPELRTGELPPASARGIHGETYGSGGALVARFRRLRAGDRGLIAAPWTPLASLCLPFQKC
jgi:hypothetical protein